MIIIFTDGTMTFGMFVVHGACNLKDRTVFVDRTSGFLKFIKNFIHEVGHMCLPKNPINPSHDLWDNIWIFLRKYGVV